MLISILKFKVLLILIVLNISPSFAQKVDTVTYNQEKYFVYPYTKSIEVNKLIYRGMKKNQFVKAFIQCEHLKSKFDLKDEILVKEYKRKAKKLRNRYIKKNYYEYGCGRGRKKESKIKKFFKIYHKGFRFKNAVRKNHFAFYDPNFSFDTEITPCLDQIPDGKYIQYFEPFLIGDKHGNVQLVNKRVATIFYIKNNFLEGNLICLNIDGDTLMKGVYKTGIKEGEWKLTQLLNKIYDSKIENKYLIKHNTLKLDTSFVTQNYLHDILQGAYEEKSTRLVDIRGFYTNGQKSGTWIEKAAVSFYDTVNHIYLKDYTRQITRLVCTFDSLNHPVKFYPIRYHSMSSTMFNQYSNDDTYDLFNYYNILSSNLQFSYRLKNNSEYEYKIKNAYYDIATKQQISYINFRDSFKLIPKYTGVYKKYYPNGQLFHQCNFIDGLNTLEDTVFWDNGKPFDVVSYLPENQIYERKIFYKDGSVSEIYHYTSKGEFVKKVYDGYYNEIVIIDKLKAVSRKNTAFYEYKWEGGINQNLDTVILEKKWSKKEKKMLFFKYYLPRERTLICQYFQEDGFEYQKIKYSFNDTYTIYKKSQMLVLDDFKLLTDSEGKFFNYNAINLSKDNISLEDRLAKKVASRGVENILYVNTLFSEEVLEKTRLKNDSLYNGPIEITFRGKKFKKINAYKYILPFGSMDNYTNQTQHFNEVDCSKSFSFFCSFLIDYTRVSKPNDNFPYFNKVRGAFKNGNPEGIWEIFDNKGNLIAKLNFKDGKLDGPIYKYEFDKKSFPYLKRNTLPKTHSFKYYYYMLYEKNYTNGKLEGGTTNYNINGFPVFNVSYHNGLKQGEYFEKFGTTRLLAHYQNDTLQGKRNLFYLNSNKDSIYLLKSNFLKGKLDGEALLYHANGKIAKQSYFKDGIIEGKYQAFDTLGNLYHEILTLNKKLISEKRWKNGTLIEINNFKENESQVYLVKKFITEHVEYLLEDYFDETDTSVSVEKNLLDYVKINYYSNGKISSQGSYHLGEKFGLWNYFNLDGKLVYSIDHYLKSEKKELEIKESIFTQIEGILTEYDANGEKLCVKAIINSYAHYDCPDNFYYNVYPYYFTSDSINKPYLNSIFSSYYVNGVKQSEGEIVDGLPNGYWFFYDPYGKLYEYGKYISGLKQGRWLQGDIGKIKYLGNICFKDEMDYKDFEAEVGMKLEFKSIFYTNGTAIKSKFYKLDWEKQILIEEDLMSRGGGTPSF
ncbi:MAG: hypothetical protein HYR91_09945 [Flavobacteriia bacterium]|nr:hypothetical protein [Flavobacteriia bacterium]